MTTANLAVADNETVVQYESTGEDEFDFPFPILASDELKVSIDQVMQTLGTDYTINGVGDDSGGSVEFPDGTTAGQLVTIWLDMPIKRLTGFALGAATLLPQALNTEFARQVRIDQMLRRNIGRSFQIPIDDDSAGQLTTLPRASLRRNKVFGFDSNGNPSLLQEVDAAALASRNSLGEILYPQTDAEDAEGVTPVYYYIGALGAIIPAERYGASPSASAAVNQLAIQTAINVANRIGGGTVLLGAGTYQHTGQLDLLNNVTLHGAGKASTFLESSHLGDGVASVNPINTSSRANVEIAFLTVKNTNVSNTGGGYTDLCGSYVVAYNMGVQGFKYGIIFDQTELAEIDLCNIESRTTGIWMVNGPSRVVGVLGGFTNRISVTRCQLNGPSDYCVVDDGGVCHVYADNNYNGSTHHMRCSGVTGLHIRGGEWESASDTCIIFSHLNEAGGANGQCGNVTIDGSPVIVPSGSNVCIHCESGPTNFTIGNVFMGGNAPAKITGTSNINNLYIRGASVINTGVMTDGYASRHDEMHWDSSGLAIRKTNIANVQQLVPITYSASMTPLARAGNEFYIVANDANAFTINAPTAVFQDGQLLRLTIHNTSGGALGTATWNAVYKMAAWTQPATGFNRSIEFRRQNGSWYEVSRTAADVPN